MGTQSALVLEESPTWSALALEGPDSLNHIELDSFFLEFIGDSCRNQLPMFPSREVIQLLVHCLLELVPERDALLPLHDDDVLGHRVRRVVLAAHAEEGERVGRALCE